MRSIRRRMFWRTTLAMALPVVLLFTPVSASLDAAESAQTPTTLSIAAASDLKFAMDEVVIQFEKSRPDIDVMVSYGSSGNFFGQLLNRAPFDLFFSADVNYPKQLGAQGLGVEGSQFLYGEGRIVVWVPNDSKLDVQTLGIKSLLAPSVRKIAIANPRHAPYGRAAETALKNLGIYDAVKHKLVFGENISQTAQFIQSGAADIGIIALSLVVAPALKSEGRYWPVPETAYPKLEQAGIILKWAKSLNAAQAFKAFVTGPEGRTVLKRYGFVLPGE